MNRWLEDVQLNVGRGLLSIWRAFVPHPGDHYARLADDIRKGYTGAGTHGPILVEHAVAALVKMNEALPSMHDLMPPRHQGMIIEVEGYQVEV